MEYFAPDFRLRRKPGRRLRARKRVLRQMEYLPVQHEKANGQSGKLQIPEESKPLSQLTISVPAGLTVKNKISVSDQSGHQVNTNVLVNANKLILAFPNPVAPGNELKIAMKDVKISGVTDAWLYKVYAKLVGINAELPIGFARFPIYRR